MTASVRVDLHCHSSCSDGAFPPEGVAHLLAAAGVRLAALTDHDTLDGTARFGEALEQRGIRPLVGVELAHRHPLGEIHLLAIGFRPEAFRPGSSGLPGLGRALRVAWGGRFRSGKASAAGGDSTAGGSAAALIARVHDAGGRVYLAHPLFPITEFKVLERLLAELKRDGLDGIEALYKSYAREVRSRLARLALDHELLVIAGSDFHGDGVHGSAHPGCEMPRWHWERFCAAHGLEPGQPECEGEEMER